ncbi:MFS transporter [Rhodovibrionaceae bacterium A322]
MALSDRLTAWKNNNPTILSVSTAWALLLGMSMLIFSNSLLNTLLSLRADIEGFPVFIIGVVMAGYSVGFLVGSLYVERLLRTVGHVRVFAALASVASVASLIHGLVVDPYTWGAMRFVTGFCLAALYVVAESWLNDSSSNETRGTLLSIYMLLNYLGYVAGQMVLNVAPPTNISLFIFASIALSLALVPLLLSSNPAPRFEATEGMSLKKLYITSPLGVLASIGAGMALGGLFNLGAVYGQQVGLTLGEITFLMAAPTVGGALLQYPIGRLSDKFDRRKVILLVCMLATVFPVAGIYLGGLSPWVLMGCVALYGGMVLPLYSLAIAHTNDQLKPEQMVAASAGLVTVYGVGYIIGPLSSSSLMGLIGSDGFFWYLAILHAFLAAFAIFRMTRRAAVPLDEQGPYVAMPARTSPLAEAVAEEVAEEIAEELAEEEAAAEEAAAGEPTDAAGNSSPEKEKAPA